MNRLILIGNGFDLAHGLKTSVKDFAEYYFNKVFEEVIRNSKYEDSLIEFYLGNINYQPEYKNLYNSQSFSVKKDNLENNRDFKKRFKNPIIEEMYHGIAELNWFNIEKSYFENLYKYVKNNPKDLNYIKLYNRQFEFLKSEFLNYLELENSKIDGSFVNEKFIDSFFSNINKEEFILDCENSDAIEKIMYLSFNYTELLIEYYKNVRSHFNSSLNLIHGSLDNRYGKPIFGYGDEHNSEYLRFEELDNNELYTHIKSFQYSLNSNYYKLTRFLDDFDFQVFIYGHSCGMTDRTLLNQIFEHDNCKSIKVFYYKRPDSTNDYTGKSYEISRHFKDKTLFRKKLVPFDMCKPMPQLK